MLETHRFGVLMGGIFIWQDQWQETRRGMVALKGYISCGRVMSHIQCSIVLYVLNGWDLKASASKRICQFQDYPRDGFKWKWFESHTPGKGACACWVPPWPWYSCVISAGFTSFVLIYPEIVGNLRNSNARTRSKCTLVASMLDTRPDVAILQHMMCVE